MYATFRALQMNDLTRPGQAGPRLIVHVGINHRRISRASAETRRTTFTKLMHERHLAQVEQGLIYVDMGTIQVAQEENPLTIARHRPFVSFHNFLEQCMDTVRCGARRLSVVHANDVMQRDTKIAERQQYKEISRTDRSPKNDSC